MISNIGDRCPCGNHAKPPIEGSEFAQKRLEGRLTYPPFLMDQADFGAAPARPEPIRFDVVATSFASLSPFSQAVPSRGSGSPNQVRAASRNSSADEELSTGALSVEGPTKNELCRTIMFSSHSSEPMVDERGLPDTGPGNDRDDIYMLV